MGYYPNFRHEKKLYRQGYQLIAGLDEAGRGSWAGPLVAAAVILDPAQKIKGLKDSKKITALQRQEIFKVITTRALAWAVGVVSQTNIDKIGITRANVTAMQEAIKNLSCQPDFILIDSISIPYRNVPMLSINKADYKIATVAAASIVAKVTRDQIMNELDEKYPRYGFKQHKGYGTNHHLQMLVEHGVSQIHRRSFQPIKDLEK